MAENEPDLPPEEPREDGKVRVVYRKKERQEPDPELAGRVSKLRLGLCMTQPQFAQALGCTPGYVSLLERGRRQPSDVVLRRLELLEQQANEPRPPWGTEHASELERPSDHGRRQLDDWDLQRNVEQIQLPAEPWPKPPKTEVPVRCGCPECEQTFFFNRRNPRRQLPIPHEPRKLNPQASESERRIELARQPKIHVTWDATGKIPTGDVPLDIARAGMRQDADARQKAGLSVLAAARRLNLQHDLGTWRRILDRDALANQPYLVPGRLASRLIPRR